MDPFCSSTFIDLLNSQRDSNESLFPSTVGIGSIPVPRFTNQTIEPAWDCEEVIHVKMKRTKWTPKDDIVLCSSWLNTSKNVVVANEQKYNAFWILEHPQTLLELQTKSLASAK
ncbi:unnamed protein product [Cochlearia groenlandica]